MIHEGHRTILQTQEVTLTSIHGTHLNEANWPGAPAFDDVLRSKGLLAVQQCYDVPSAISLL